MKEQELILALLIIYSVLFLSIKSYVKTYIPIMLIGYLVKVYNIANMESISNFFIYTVSFLISFNMGEKVEKTFFKNLNPPIVVSNILEKLILTLLFFTVFLLVAPHEIIPLHFIIFSSVINFIYSGIFVQNPKTSENFNINNIIIYLFILIFYLLFKESKNPPPFLELAPMISIYIITLILFLKLKIESKTQIIATFLVVAGLSITVSIMLNIIPLILGFSFSILLNLFSKTKSLIIKDFLKKISPYYIIPLLFFSGYILEISYNFLIISLIYTIIRISIRVLYFLLSDNPDKSIKSFITSHSPFLVQGEELLIFFAIYALEFNFKSALTIIMVSLIFSEILINYLHNYFKKQQG